MMYYLPKLNLAKSVVLVDGQESDPLDDLAEKAEPFKVK